MKSKARISKKWANEHFVTIFKTGYCNLYYLFKYTYPDYYSAGRNGWSCDYYYFEPHDILISTGYSPIGTSIPYEITSSFEDKAMEIIYSRKPFSDFESERVKLNNLIEHFLTTLEELKKGELI